MEEQPKNQTNPAIEIDILNHPPRLILASASPRRAEILRTISWPFEASPVDADESVREDEAASAYVQRLALTKAELAAVRTRGALVLGADTTVVLEDQILGKPTDAAEAKSMLQALKGNWHEVLTGLALVKGDSIALVNYEATRVRFAPMSESEIDWYVSTGEPMDKAGGYAIQGLGARFIEKIEGDFFNVVGLPIRLLYRLTRELLASAKS